MLKPVFLCFFALAHEQIFIKMHIIQIRFITGLEDILCAGMCMNFSAQNFLQAGAAKGLKHLSSLTHKTQVRLKSSAHLPLTAEPCSPCRQQCSPAVQWGTWTVPLPAQCWLAQGSRSPPSGGQSHGRCCTPTSWCSTALPLPPVDNDPGRCQ